MSGDTSELVVLVGLLATGALVGFVGHAVTRHFLVVVVAAGLLASGWVELSLRAHGDDWRNDKFGLVVLVYPAVASSFAAAIVGIPFALRRKTSRAALEHGTAAAAQVESRSMSNKELDDLVADLRSVAGGALGECEFRAKYQAGGPVVLEYIWDGLQHFLSDADIRAKDAGYREMQLQELDRLITLLLSGASAKELRRITFLGRSSR